MLHLQHNYEVQRPESEIVDSFTRPLTTEEMPPKELVGLKVLVEEDAKGERTKGNLNLALPYSAAGAAIRNGSGSSAVVNSEYSSGAVWLETVDGDAEEVDREVALLSPLIQREVLRFGLGESQDDPVVLPKQVSPSVLKLILEYCRFHRVPGRSDKERKLFDEKFIRLDTRRLCELTSAADSLDMKPLVDLTSRALARMIEGKTPEEIRETFHLPDDLTEEEKLEPVKNATDDPRIRLLNRLYARKRKELQEKKCIKSSAPPGREKERDEKGGDERSVDELLTFIDGSRRDGKGGKSGKGKKKKKKGKKEAAEEAPAEPSGGKRDLSLHPLDQPPHKVEESPPSGMRSGGGWVGNQADIMQALDKMADKLHSACLEELAAIENASKEREKEPSDDADAEEEEGLDPVLKHKLEREVEEFGRRLSSEWVDRKEEILALASSSREQLGPPSSLLRSSPSSPVAVQESDLEAFEIGDTWGSPVAEREFWVGMGNGTEGGLGGGGVWREGNECRWENEESYATYVNEDTPRKRGKRPLVWDAQEGEEEGISSGGGGGWDGAAGGAGAGWPPRVCHHSVSLRNQLSANSSLFPFPAATTAATTHPLLTPFGPNPSSHFSSQTLPSAPPHTPVAATSGPFSHFGGLARGGGGSLGSGAMWSFSRPEGGGDGVGRGEAGVPVVFTSSAGSQSPSKSTNTSSPGKHHGRRRDSGGTGLADRVGKGSGLESNGDGNGGLLTGSVTHKRGGLNGFISPVGNGVLGRDGVMEDERGGPLKVQEVVDFFQSAVAAMHLEGEVQVLLSAPGSSKGGLIGPNKDDGGRVGRNMAVHHSVGGVKLSQELSSGMQISLALTSMRQGRKDNASAVIVDGMRSLHMGGDISLAHWQSPQ